MRIFDFGPGAGRHIDRFGSNFVISRLAHTDGIHVACMHLPPGGLVGRHQAVTNQLFIVVHGDGWVEGEDGTRRPVTAGEAAFWTAGEMHAAGGDAGMTAIVVEGDVLTPNAVGPIPSGMEPTATPEPVGEGSAHDEGAETVIRPYEAGDRDDVGDVLRSIEWEDRYVSGQLLALDQVASGSNELHALVALEGERVTGFVSLAIYEWNRLGKLHGLAVDAEYQRRGIASSLVREAEESVRTHGGRGVMVDTPVTNRAARSFYAALSYRQDYIMSQYYDAGLDGVTYVKFFES